MGESFLIYIKSQGALIFMSGIMSMGSGILKRGK